MIAVRRVVFFVVSTIIIALFVWWGFDGFEPFTKINPPIELLNEETGRVYVQTKGNFVLGLDIVLVASIGLSSLGIVIINFFKAWFASRESNSSKALYKS